MQSRVEILYSFIIKVSVFVFSIWIKARDEYFELESENPIPDYKLALKVKELLDTTDYPKDLILKYYSGTLSNLEKFILDIPEIEL